MIFYEVNNPYYALIKANDKKDAINEYIKTVADNDGTLEDEIKVVDAYYAVLKYGKGCSEDDQEISFNDILADLHSQKTKTLLFDGALL